MPAMCMVNSQFCLCTSLVPRPMIVVIWPGDKTTCAHAYNIRKWRPLQWTAATECCEWLLLTGVNLKLWRRRLVAELRVVIRISFVLKWRWILKSFSRYHCWNIEGWMKKKERRIRKMALSLLHILAFSCLPHGFWPLIWVLLITKALKEEVIPT